MHRAIVDANGRLDLGDAALRAGFKPGQLVDIIVTCLGSLIVALADDDSQAVDAYARQLPSKRGQLAISGAEG